MVKGGRKAGDVARSSVTEHLLRMHKALGLIHSTKNKRKRKKKGKGREGGEERRGGMEMKQTSESISLLVGRFENRLGV